MKNPMGRLGVMLAVVFVCGLACAPARADDQVGVARISVLHGGVTIQRGDAGDSVAAALNAPVMVGDYLTTAGGARTEVQLDNSNFVRVSSDAQLRFTHLESNDHALQLAEGTVELRVLSLNDSNPEVDTPSIGIRPDEAGRYRVTVTHDGDTIFTVRSGRADLLAPYGTQTLAAGASLLVRGPSSKPQISSIDTVAYDDFDSWNSERDQYVSSTFGSGYANSDIVGLDDLQSYGHWIDNGDYGHVWVPYHEDADWAPYHDGRWAWEPGCGWTWVGYEPWGWAPYHYGRWFYAAPYGWAWYPGPEYVAPVWQPALVAFFGFGNGFGFSLAFGNIGWVPLAPFEPFHPWWGRGLAYAPTIINNTTNITNITNVTYNITNINIYKNAGKPNALGIVARHEFENGSVYHYMPVARQELDRVAVLKGALPVVPSRENLRFNGQAPSPVALSPRFQDLPSPKQTRSFQDERRALQGMIKPQVAAGQTPKLSITPIRGERPLPGAAPQAPVLRHELSSGAVAPAIKSSFIDGSPGSAWSRFAAARGETTGAAASAGAHQSPVVVAPGLSKGASTAVRQIPSGASSPWSRFGSEGGPQLRRDQPVHVAPRMRTVTPLQSDGGITPHGQRTLPVQHNQSAWERFSPDGAVPGRSVPSYRRYPGYRQSPTYRESPAYRQSPTFRQYPTYREYPAYPQSQPAGRAPQAPQSQPAARAPQAPAPKPQHRKHH